MPHIRAMVRSTLLQVRKERHIALGGFPPVCIHRPPLTHDISGRSSSMNHSRFESPQWREALSSRGQVSEIRGSSSSRAQTLGNPISSDQILSKRSILDSSLMIFYVDSICANESFPNRPQVLTICRDFVEIFRFL